MKIKMLMEPSFALPSQFFALWVLSLRLCTCNYLNHISQDLFQVIEAEVASAEKSNILRKSLSRDQRKTILVFTKLFGSYEWPNLRSMEGDTFLKKYGCPFTNCRLKYNTDDVHMDGANLMDANIVVFHDKDMPDWATLKELSNSARPKDQIWVYFTGENPFHSHHDVEYLDDLFDWTMTYKRDSDIWLPYFRFFPKASQLPRLTTNYAKSKKYLIAWLVSNCGLMRERVVDELYQLLPVHVGGSCSKFYPDKLECESNNDCDKKIKDFKFYLAFENNLCDDYITEKYWYRAISNGVVPIILGGSLYNSRFSVIPGSYINVLDFKNIDALVEYIKYLDSNDTAYNEYFKWKSKYSLWKPICDWPYEPYWACQMCMRLNIGIQRKQRIKMSKYWSPDSNCKKHERYLDIFLEKSGHDFHDFDSRRQAAVNPYNTINKELDYQEEATGNRQKGVEDSYEGPPQVAFDFETREESNMTLLNGYDFVDYREYNVLLFFSCAVIGFLIFIFKVR